MTTPQQFIEALLEEKSSVYAEANARLEPVFARYFGEPLAQHANDFLLRDRQVVDEVRQSAFSAIVITRARYKAGDVRTRYRLATVSEGWKITGIDRACFICSGTGRCGEEVCQKCDGEGWYDNRKNAG